MRVRGSAPNRVRWARCALPQGIGEKHLDRLSHQIITPVAEQLLHLAVDQQNLPLLVHHHHPVRRRLHQRRCHHLIHKALARPTMAGIANHVVSHQRPPHNLRKDPASKERDMVAVAS